MSSINQVVSQINQARLWERHERLAEIGATGRGGVNRQALSKEEILARKQLREWGSVIGLVPYSDAIGNFFLRYPGENGDLAPVVTGSHIDTQPTGGRFDGSFGVLAAIEVIEAMHATGYRPHRSVELVAWTNEEGSRFAPGMMGSAVFRGQRELDAMLAIRDSDGVSVGESVAAIRSAESEVCERPLGFSLAAYIEAHIEQGPILELQRKVIGVVSGIQGKRVFRVTVDGEENHAGTSPRAMRKDALVAAVNMIGALHDAIYDSEDVVKFTVGRFEVRPNAPSVVPAAVHFSIDLRHPDDAVLQRLGDSIEPVCTQHQGPCTVAVKELSNDPALEFPVAVRDTIRAIAKDLSISYLDMPSAAGHDARHINYLCPTGMIFIPCEGGISHNEAESCEAEHLFEGARVLAGTVMRLAEMT